MRKITVLIGTPEELGLASVGPVRVSSSSVSEASIVFVEHSDGTYGCHKHRFRDRADFNSDSALSLQVVEALIGRVRIGYSQGPVYIKRPGAPDPYVVKCKKCDNLVETAEDPTGKVVFCSEDCMRKN